MKDRLKIEIIIWGILIGISAAALTWMAKDTYKYAMPDPKAMQIIDKYEADGKCYIQTWIEITPEEYIGYDIGDEYKEKQ